MRPGHDRTCLELQPRVEILPRDSWQNKMHFSKIFLGSKINVYLGAIDVDANNDSTIASINDKKFKMKGPFGVSKLLLGGCGVVF